MNKTIIALLFLLIIPVAFARTDYTTNSETECENNICTTTVYSYEKYWDDNGEWEQIDENLYNCSDERTRYCSNEYYYQFTADDQGTVQMRWNENMFGMQLRQFGDTEITSYEPVIQDNTLTYVDVIPGYVDILYEYLPTRLKETIILKQPLQSREQDIQAVFSLSNREHMRMADFIVCDSNDICEPISHTFNGSDMIITIPRELLQRKQEAYPLYIDPTLLFNETNISWNGYIVNESDTAYKRTNNSASIFLGNLLTEVGQPSRHARAAMTWNLENIPENASIYSASLQVYMDTGAGAQNISLQVRGLDQLDEDYPDENGSCDGNCQFYTDIDAATIYKDSTYISSQTHTINISDGSEDITEATQTGKITLGFTGSAPSPGQLRIGAKDNTNVSRRPKLTLVYGAGATDADNAIVEGIENALGSVAIGDSQQVYIVDTSSTHHLGTFDKGVVHGNQTWAFHYVQPGGFFLNIPSLFRALNIWENQSLSYEEIVLQVETFINQTKT